MERAVELRLTNLSNVREKNLLYPLNTGINERKLNTAILRLRIGHFGLWQHLHRLKLIESPNCEYCGQIESIDHILIHCPRYHSHRTRLRHALFALNIPFERKRILGWEEEDPEIRKNVFRHLAVFIKTTNLQENII